MSLSVLAILTIAVLGVVLWLMARPGVEEAASPRENTERSARNNSREMSEARSPASQAVHEPGAAGHWTEESMVEPGELDVDRVEDQDRSGLEAKRTTQRPTSPPAAMLQKCGDRPSSG